MSIPLALESMEAFALAQEGERLCRENNMRAAVKCLEMALEKEIDVGDRTMEAVSAIYCQLGNAYIALNDFNNALKYHRYDLDATRILNDKVGIAKAHGNLANVYKALSDYDQAYEHAVSHLQVARDIKDLDCEARALYIIACIYQCRAKTVIDLHPNIFDGTAKGLASNPDISSNLHAAINYYTKNLEVVEKLNNLTACGRAYGNLGNTYYLLGEFETAVRYHNKRLDIARQFGDRAAMQRAFTNLGNAHIYLSKPAKAIEYYRNALLIAAELNDDLTEFQCCFIAGNGLVICDDLQSAVEYHTRCLKVARRLCNQIYEAQACTSLLIDYEKLGDRKKAIYFGLLSMQICRNLGDQISEKKTKRSLERVLRSMEQFSQRRASDISIDVSGDPEPEQVTALYSSLQSLLSAINDDSNQANTSSKSTTDTANTVAVDERLDEKLMDDGFFEMISRLQSKRINDQRCDLSTLGDLTNRSNDTRQSDTIDIDGVEGMLNLIASLQGRRMEEQRAHLNVTVKDSDQVEPSGNSDVEPSRTLLRSFSEDANILYETLIRSQSGRLEEQRSDLLPSTIPYEDISRIVLTMQKGRIETQRAHLSAKIDKTIN